MATSDFTGMFRKLGIDSSTEEQLLAKNAIAERDERNAALDATREDYPGQRAIQRAGAGFGAALKERFNPNKLDPAQQRQVDAMAEATSKFQDARANGDYLGADGNADLNLEQQGFQSFVAGSLINYGDTRGIEMAKALEIERRANAENNEARVLGGLTIEDQRRSAVNDIYDFNRGVFLDKRGETATIWMQGSDDANSSRDVHIDDEGTAHTADGTQFPLGTYTTSQPVTASSSGSSKGPQVKDFMSTTEAGKLRSQHRTLAAQMEMAVGMRDALSDGIGEDGTLEIMGTGGKLQKWAGDLVNNFITLGRASGSVLSFEGSDGKVTGTFDGSTAGAQRYVKKNKSIFKDMAIPEEIRGDSNAIARYQAIIVQMAYGQAKMNDEGGRVTNEDFANGVQQIGANATDPEALRQILVGNLERSVKTFNVWDQQLPKGIRNQVIHEDARRLFDETFKNFNAAFGTDFGSNAKPGKALTNPQGSRTAGTSVGRTAPADGFPVTSSVSPELQARREALEARKATLAARKATVDALR